MLLSEIITRFELYSDDQTELSGAEEYTVANKVLSDIYNENDWEWLRKRYSGTTDSLGQLALPTDFMKFMHNYSAEGGTPNTKVVWVNNIPYPIIPLGLATQYDILSFSADSLAVYGNSMIATSSIAAYVENNTLKFTQGFGANSPVKFDYKYRPATMIGTDAPLWDSSMHQLLVNGMLIDDDVIQRSIKANSNVVENRAAYNKYLSNLRMLDASNTYL
jgi:hypothetical protein